MSTVLEHRVLAPTAPHIRRWHRALAHLRSWSLDDALAAGLDPRTDPLRSVRAAHLVSSAERAALADAWDDLLGRAERPSSALVSNRLPVAHALRTISADVHALTAALRAPGPVSARGVAAARLLLARGDSPVYRPGAGADRLGAAVRGATAWLSGGRERAVHPG